MIAVIFEVEPAPGQRGAYLDLAAGLAPGLAEIDGFLSVERFESLSRPGRILSLSFWRDERSVQAWRNRAEHRAAQRAGRGDGRGGVFQDYRLRVAAVIRDYGLNDRDDAPEDSRRQHG